MVVSVYVPRVAQGLLQYELDRRPLLPGVPRPTPGSFLGGLLRKGLAAPGTLCHDVLAVFGAAVDRPLLAVDVLKALQARTKHPDATLELVTNALELLAEGDRLSCDPISGAYYLRD